MSKASRVVLVNQRRGWMKRSRGALPKKGRTWPKAGGGVGWDAQEIGWYLEVLGEEGVGAAVGCPHISERCLEE